MGVNKKLYFDDVEDIDMAFWVHFVRYDTCLREFSKQNFNKQLSVRFWWYRQVQL